MLNSAKAKSWQYIKRYCPEYISKSKRFGEVLRPLLRPEVTLIDLGCGRGKETSIAYKDLTHYSLGLDISKAIALNQTIHQPILGNVYDIPLRDASVDLIVTQELMEHLEHPEKMFLEISRILRASGIFATMLPNIWYPTTLVSYVTPYSFHQSANRILHGIHPSDVFPTWYRANTLRQLRQLGKQARLDVIYHEYFKTNPGDLSFSPLLTRLEVAYHRLLARFEALGFLRDILIIVYRKH